MPMRAAGELPFAIAGMLRSPAGNALVTEVVARCHRMAVAYLRVRTASRSFDPGRLGLTVEDFAYDAIAELFRRDEENRYIVLERAFEPLQPLEHRAPEFVEQELRRQVLNVVLRQIYRSYRDTDPALARIIRNIKQTLRSHETARMIDIRGDWMVAPADAHALLITRPVMPPELLAPEVSARSNRASSLRGMLGAVADALREQDDYSRVFPLVGVALIIRSIYAAATPVDGGESGGEALTAEDLDRLLAPALDRVMTRAARYVRDGKLTDAQLVLYRRTLRDIVIEEVTGGMDEDVSFFEILTRHDPSISRAQYHAKHRVILEYLIKLVRREVRDILGNEWKRLERRSSGTM